MLARKSSTQVSEFLTANKKQQRVSQAIPYRKWLKKSSYETNRWVNLSQLRLKTAHFRFLFLPFPHTRRALYRALLEHSKVLTQIIRPSVSQHTSLYISSHLKLTAAESSLRLRLWDCTISSRWLSICRSFFFCFNLDSSCCVWVNSNYPEHRRMRDDSRSLHSSLSPASLRLSRLIDHKIFIDFTTPLNPSLPIHCQCQFHLVTMISRSLFYGVDKPSRKNNTRNSDSPYVEFLKRKRSDFGNGKSKTNSFALPCLLRYMCHKPPSFYFLHLLLSLSLLHWLHKHFFSSPFLFYQFLRHRRRAAVNFLRSLDKTSSKKLIQ